MSGHARDNLVGDGLKRSEPHCQGNAQCNRFGGATQGGREKSFHLFLH
jgi:hypothetical protein